MRATDLKTELPLVRRETAAVDAARLIAEGGRIGLVVADDAGSPVAIISATDVMRLMLPGYILEDLSLANVFDEEGANDLWAEIDSRTIGELLDDEEVPVREILAIDADATLVEIAARMADAHAQIARVTGLADDSAFFLTLPVVMEAILSYCQQAPSDGASR